MAALLPQVCRHTTDGVHMRVCTRASAVCEGMAGTRTVLGL